MIPKVIHYCWFGREELPKSIKDNINMWKIKLPDYKFIEWNENNFNINYNTYVKQAYKSKKYAFVSDVARLYALYEYGGIYLDTDIEIVKNFEGLIQGYELVLGLENSSKHVATSFICASKKNEIIYRLLKDYDERVFIIEKNNYNTTPNTVYITEKLENMGLNLGYKGEKQELSSNMAIYNDDYFSSYNLEISKPIYGKNTYLVHHFNASWESQGFKMRQAVKQLLINIFGVENYIFFRRIIRKNRIKR